VQQNRIPISSRRYVGDNLLEWKVAHELSVRLSDGALIVADSNALSYHLLRLYSTELLYRLVRIKCILRPLQSSSVHFYVHHYGAVDVAEFALDGTILNRGVSRSAWASLHSDGSLELEVSFLCCHPTLSIGTSKNHAPVYAGTGEEQFALLQVQVDLFDATPELSATPVAERLTLVDVGGQEGLQLKWMLKADRLTPVLFEPIASEAALLRQTIPRIPGAQVIEKALAHKSGAQTLHIAAASGCSSLRKPNFEVLDRYSIGKIFTTVGTAEVQCVRYDQLFASGEAPAPDAIKIDVQGFEYEVLLGFGHLLEDCLGIELEAHFVPVYLGQKLFADIVDILSYFGFAVRAIRQLPNYDGDFIEFDAYFTKRREYARNLPDYRKQKFLMIADVWDLPQYKI